MLALTFQTPGAPYTINVEPEKGAWLLGLLHELHISKPASYTLQMIKEDYERAGLEDFELFWDNKPVNTLHRAGLLRV